MKIHENLKNEGKSRKTISLVEGFSYDLSCSPRAFLIHAKFKWDPQNAKRSSPKTFGMGYVKMHGFHGNPLYDSGDWE